jgi:hypothetical protein
MSSKSTEKAVETKQELTGGGDVGKSVQACPLQKHFIKLVVKDTDGKPVPAVKPTLDVDGSSTSVGLDANGKYDTTKVLDSTADAKISFPDLYDCDWWPQEGSAPTPAGEKDLPAVAEGDCVVRMAAVAGYRSYHDIWDAAENAAKKPDRPILNALLKGDVFKGPEKKEKVVTKAVDKEWTFIVRAIKKPKLRIVIVDRKAKPLKDVKWTLSGVTSKNGTTGANGLIEALDIDPLPTAGNLKISVPPWEKQSKTFGEQVRGFFESLTGPSAAPETPPYPMPIKPEDFKDEKPVLKPLATELQFDLKLGCLPVHKDKSGTLARMSNMAFLLDVAGTEDELKRCVKAYQRLLLDQKQPTGAVDDIKEDAETRHTKA